MKKVLVGLGLICLLVGFLIILWAASYETKVNSSTFLVGETRLSWEVSSLLSNFTAGNRLIFQITPAREWGFMLDPWQGTDFPIQKDHLSIDISIIDPNGGKTNMTVYFVEAGPAEIYVPIQFFAATVISNDGGLSMEKEYIIAEKNGTAYYNYNNAVSGIVNYDGPYKVVIINDYALGTKPLHLELYKQYVEREKPYFFLVPIGGIIIGIGFVLIVIAMRKTRHKVRQGIVKKR